MKFVKYNSAHITPKCKTKGTMKRLSQCLFLSVTWTNRSCSFRGRQFMTGFNRIVMERRKVVRHSQLRSGNVKSVAVFEQELNAISQKWSTLKRKNDVKRTKSRTSNLSLNAQVLRSAKRPFRVLLHHRDK